MPRKVLALSLAVAAVPVALELAGPSAADAGERWRRPLPGGAVVGAFTFERAEPYVRGRRRGIDLAGARGAPVLAACGGTVTYAGRVPGRGRGVTLRCGRLIATELGLSKAIVSRGARVRTGEPIGLLGARAILRLGARIASDRHGYIDPSPLLDDDQPPSLAPPPIAARRHRRTSPPARPLTAPRPAAKPSSLPWPALAGLILATTATAGGGAITVRRRRRVHRHTSPAQR